VALFAKKMMLPQSSEFKTKQSASGISGDFKSA